MAPFSVGRRATPIAAALLTLLLWPLLPAAATSPPEPAELTGSNVDTWLDGLLPALLEREAIPGAVVSVVHDGDVVTERGYGSAITGTASDAPLAADPQETAFRVGSVSKLVVATAVMQLVERGELDLDVPVADYLDFELSARFDITLRHLLSHTAGFEDVYRWVMLDPGSEVPALRDVLATDPPEQIFEPGTVPAYSNYGYALAAYVVQQVSGRDFAEYARAEVFDPSGMTTADFAQPPSGTSVAQPYPTSHAEPIPFELVGLWPVGSVSATAADMSAFMLAHLSADSPLLAAQTLTAMQAPALDEASLGNLAAGPRMTLGFFQEGPGDGSVLGHGGDLTHSHAHLQLYPEHATGIFVAVNGSGARPESSTALRNLLLHGFVDRYLPAGSEAPSPTDTAAEHAEAVAGSYILSRRGVSTFTRANAVLSPVEVTAEGDGIRVAALTDGSGHPVRLVEVEPWVWQETDGQRRLAARLDDAGAVEALSLGPAFTLQPQPTWQGLLVPVLLGSLGVLVVALISWPVRALVGRRFGAPPGLAPLDRRLRRISMLAVVAALGSLALWYAAATVLLSGGSVGAGLLRGAQAATALGVLGVVPAAWRAVRAWARRSWWQGALASLIALAFVGFAWAMIAAGTLLPDISY